MILALKTMIGNLFNGRKENSLRPHPTKRRNPFPSQIRPSLVDQDSGLLIEDYFHQRLRSERKRTERSQNPFLMMLLDVRMLASLHKEWSQEIVSALFLTTRETDSKGWYESDKVIGVIFTELNGIEHGKLQDKIIANLSKHLSEDLLRHVKISFHPFPEKKDDEQKPGSTPDIRLYADVLKQDDHNKGSRMMKRAVDIVGSLFAIVLFSPLFLIIPILIKLTSSGPVLFRQVRVGLHGRKFVFLKFRSMYVDNDPKIHMDFVKNLIQSKQRPDNAKSKTKQKTTYKITNDPRVTRIGRWLRITSLDELPQFFNVLKGEMSLVGPRPPIPYEVENYNLWHRCRVLEVKPGITGLWQVKGRSSTTFDEMVRLDIQYIQEWSLSLDIRILLATPVVVLIGKGAY